ncbi:MAG: metallophosphoesterase [Candidatus Cloacimonetes bacterium]|nr:metallophosphoesterase [Candidatus Cloacimonadota bacterium]
MDLCFFVSDLHGQKDRYEKLFAEILKDKPSLVLFGGDLLPSFNSYMNSINDVKEDFITDYLASNFSKLQNEMGKRYPLVCMILGNDDQRSEEKSLIESGKNGLWEYIHNRKISFKNYNIYGYSFVPPTPFMLKDWEKYDVSRFVDVGCVDPQEGYRTFSVSDYEIKYSTIKEDIENLVKSDNLQNSIFLFHSPPYQTHLDRAALDGLSFDHAPLDVHVGSIAIKRFIEQKQPYITLHGHIHESSRITGYWKQKIVKTNLFSAAYEKPELAIVKINMENPDATERILM